MHMVRKPSELIVPPGMRRVRVGRFAGLQLVVGSGFVLAVANMNAFGLTLKQSGNSKPWSLSMATSINRSIYPFRIDSQLLRQVRIPVSLALIGAVGKTERSSKLQQL